MSKHTPGPWQVIGGNVYGDNLRAMLPMNGADARLIAAAPDLLKALEALLLAVCANNPGGAPKTQDQIFAEAGVAAIAAIAKVRGE